MARFLPPDPTLETSIRKIGTQLFTLMEEQPVPALFSRKGAYARLMEWSMKDPMFKTQLFRFVDVLPTLNSSSEIVRHLQEYLGDQAVALHPALKAGLAASSFAPALIAKPVKAQIVDMAGQFVAGKDGADLVKQIKRNASFGAATTIDLLGETVVSAAEADAFLKRNLEILDSVSKHFARDTEPCFSDFGPEGVLPRLNLSVKISALTPEVHPADPENSIVALKERLRPILRRAIEANALINFDMESYKLKDLTLELFKSIFEETEFQTQPAIGIALQAYLVDAETDLRDLIVWARRRRRPLSIRLVKGAYWDYETILAQQRDWPIPVWQKKPESDAHFEKLTRILLENIDIVTPNFASHNVRSCAHAIAQAKQLGIDPRAFEFQALYGMADELKLSLLKMGYRVREYCAIGELLPGMAYLVRRLLENTSNEGFIRIKGAGESTRDTLLANPVSLLEKNAALPDPPDKVQSGDPPPQDARQPPFRNTPNTDFSQAAQRDEQLAAISVLTGNADPEQPGGIRLGQNYPLIINGKKITNREYIDSVNPAHPAQIIGSWARATLADADAAVLAAQAAFPAWRDTPVEERASVLERAADIMASRRFELNALETLEAGKPWMEADGDISEAIDFCRFYAVEMRTLDRPTLTQKVPGEHCVQSWIPRGIGVVIAPWNFPMAILCGLTVAPLVAGNCVIMKPAEQTSIIAAAFMDILIEAGAPPGVVNFLPGFGEDVGASLVRNPSIDFIAFTGSREVGLKLWEEAGHTHPGQKNLKKVVCEMGGKNALIIDNDADLDEAIPAALYSAFGFSGQKCSALSRLIVLDGVYDQFVTRFIAACEAYPIGDPAHPGTIIGPVIDAEAQAKILKMIQQGASESKQAWQGDAPTEGYFVPPTVFTEVKPEHVIAREEIFGPVIAILRVKDLSAAFAQVNGTDYALTGGLFSRSPTALARARDELLVGNLYLNRAITGAIVERHPFGGFKMSGGGSKAGGKDYLQNFLFPRVTIENVMRRGFTPPDDR